MDDETVPAEAGALAAAHARAGELAPGTLLAERYRIERFVARGGMGAVYAAMDRELGVAVALKTIRPDVAWSLAAIERFKREIQLARSVTHPGVCRIFDLGRHGRGDAAIVFLTMELLDGETLAERLRRGSMSADEAAPIVRQIAEALGAAHAAGVVHRDLKPANVMLARGRAVVTDFGLARQVDAAAAEQGAPPADAALTGVSGTPGYMAPEQLAGRVAGPATDVHALGVVLHEMRTGGLPDGAVDAAALEARGLEPRWARAIARCLAVDPAERFASPLEVAAAIAPPVRRRTWIASIAAALAVAAIVVAIVAWPRGHAPAPRDRPRDPEAARLYDDGVARLREGDEAEAAELLRAAIAEEPAFPLAHAELAGALFALGDHAGAREAAAAAQARSGELPREPAAVVEARLRESHEEWPRAIELYEELRRIAPGEREYALRLAYAQISGGRLREAEATIASLREGAPHPRIDMLEAFLAARRGDWPALLAACERAAAAADAVGARRLAALAWDERGVAQLNLGDAAGATASLGEAERRFRANGDRAGVARVLLHRAEVHAQRGDLAAARPLLDESLRTYREAKNRDGEAMVLVALAMYAPPDRLDESLARYDEALALYRAGGDRSGAMTTLLNIASVLYRQGDHAGFHAALEEVLRDARELGDASLVASAAINLGVVTLSEADPPRAQLYFEEARAAAARLGEGTIAAYVHAGLGEVARVRGDAATARRELEAARDEPDVADPSASIQARCGLARVEARGVAAACGAASAELEQLGAVDDAVVLAWQALRGHLADGDRAAAKPALARIRTLAGGSHDVHTALVARLASAEVAAGAASVDALARVADEAAKIGAHDLAFEARFALAQVQRGLGRRADADATLAALEEDATARGMIALARRCAAARRR